MDKTRNLIFRRVLTNLYHLLLSCALIIILATPDQVLAQDDDYLKALEEEADVADSLAEAYEVVTGSETEFLDSQLTEEMRQRVIELEDELALDLTNLDSLEVVDQQQPRRELDD